jgi:nucleotide-binding universal stress UspA family protein
VPVNVVLVGDDGSEGAAHAVAWAASLATERELRLVPVCIGPPRDGGSAPGIDRIELPADYPAAGIMQVAADVDADLIVLGRRGAGGFPSMPIGTTAHVVAGSSGRPVAVVPPVPGDDRQPLVQRVVVGVDGLPGSASALEWAASVFSDAEFLLIHALSAGPTFARARADDSESVEQARQRVSALMRDWSSMLDGDEATLETIVEEGGAAEVLLEVAERRDADAIVVGRRDHGKLRGTLGGVSQLVLAYAPCPAIVMPSHP